MRDSFVEHKLLCYVVRVRVRVRALFLRLETIIIKIDHITHADDFMRRISFSNAALNELHAVEIMNNKSTVPLRVKDAGKLVNMEIQIVKSKSYRDC